MLGVKREKEASGDGRHFGERSQANRWVKAMVARHVWGAASGLSLSLSDCWFRKEVGSFVGWF